MSHYPAEAVGGGSWLCVTFNPWSASVFGWDELQVPHCYFHRVSEWLHKGNCRNGLQHKTSTVLFECKAGQDSLRRLWKYENTVDSAFPKLFDIVRKMAALYCKCASHSLQLDCCLVSQLMWNALLCKYGRCTALICSVEALTSSLPHKETPGSAQQVWEVMEITSFEGEGRVRAHRWMLGGGMAFWNAYKQQQQQQVTVWCQESSVSAVFLQYVARLGYIFKTVYCYPYMECVWSQTLINVIQWYVY